jgi:hypothetical protein
MGAWVFRLPVPKSVITRQLLHVSRIATILDEKVHGVLDATLLHIKTLENSAKERKELVLDYDHHRRQHAKLLEKVDSVLGDAEKHSEAVKAAEERQQKVELAEAKLEAASNALARRLTLYGRAHGFVIEEITETLSGLYLHWIDLYNVIVVAQPSTRSTASSGHMCRVS